MNYTNIELILAIGLTASLVLYFIPRFFNALKSDWYIKYNRTHSDGANVKNGMYYNADKGKIHADQQPLN